VFLTIYICTNNLFLLFDNTTGMTHLKMVRKKVRSLRTEHCVMRNFVDLQERTVLCQKRRNASALRHELTFCVLTLKLPTTTIVAQPFNVIKWQLKFNLVA